MSGVSVRRVDPASLCVRDLGQKEGPEERELPWPGPHLSDASGRGPLVSILAPEPENNSDSPMSSESFEIGEGRSYWGLKCVHTERGGTPYGHDSVYRFFDADGRLLYVGHTFSILSRWAKHRRKPWWSEVRSATVSCYWIEATAREVEAAAIATEAPLYNKARPAVALR